MLDRDVNAAVNVAKAAGLAVSACGAQVDQGMPWRSAVKQNPPEAMPESGVTGGNLRLQGGGHLLRWCISRWMSSSVISWRP